MSIPYDGDSRPSCPTDCPETVGVVEHVLCALSGVVFTGALLVPYYPSLVALTEPLDVLSSTAMVVAVAALWLLVSFSVELAWEWRAGRLTVDR